MLPKATESVVKKPLDRLKILIIERQGLQITDGGMVCFHEHLTIVDDYGRFVHENLVCGGN